MNTRMISQTLSLSRLDSLDEALTYGLWCARRVRELEAQLAASSPFPPAPFEVDLGREAPWEREAAEMAKHDMENLKENLAFVQDLALELESAHYGRN